MRTVAAGLLLLLPLARGEDSSLAPLTDREWRRSLEIPAYEQPKWARRDLTSSTSHINLQRAADYHQKGDLEKTVKLLKNVLKNEPEHGEAYATLAKALDDQGKPDMAMKAQAKATRIHNERLAQWSLF